MNQPPTLRLSSWARLVGLALLLGVGVLASLGLTSRTAHAQPAVTSIVNTCDDATLRNAINNAVSGDIIKFGCSGTITLGSTLGISKNLTLDGSGQSVTLDGGGSVQVLVVFSGVTFTLSPPERVTVCPLPSRVRFLLIPSVEPRVIVPLQPKLMVSPLAALLMALRRVASSQVLTVLVAAGWAWAVLLVSPRLASRPTPSSRASPTRRAQDERRMVWC